MISSGGTGKTKFPSIIFLRGESENIFLKGESKKTRQSNWLSAPPPVLQRPFRHDRPLPQIKSDAGYTRLFMISSGGRRKTQFPYTHIFKGRIKTNMQQSNGYQMAQRIGRDGGKCRELIGIPGRGSGSGGGRWCNLHWWCRRNWLVGWIIPCTFSFHSYIHFGSGWCCVSIPNPTQPTNLPFEAHQTNSI